MGLHLQNEVAVVKTPTIISNKPVFGEENNHESTQQNIFLFAGNLS